MVLHQLAYNKLGFLSMCDSVCVFVCEPDGLTSHTDSNVATFKKEEKQMTHEGMKEIWVNRTGFMCATVRQNVLRDNDNVQNVHNILHDFVHSHTTNFLHFKLSPGAHDVW